MNVEEQIQSYILGQSETKRSEMLLLHQAILQINPTCKLWFLDGTDTNGKIVSNPNIGYGLQTIKYTNGSTKEFYRIGLSANTTGISVYIIGLEDKKKLSDTFEENIGKASVSGYCIKFKTIKEINLSVLEKAIQLGFENKR
jgi:hypothetical protein